MVSKKDRYEFIEIRFNKADELNMELYRFIEEQGKVIGKHNYILQLIFEDYKKKAAEK